MVLKDLLKSITKTGKCDYWFHIFKGDVHIGTTQLEHNNNYISLNSVSDEIINVWNYEVETFRIHEEFEFIITIK